MTIDAEVHFWKYGKSTHSPLIRNNKILREDYLPSQIAQNLERNGVDACLAVAAEPAEVESRFLSELALTHPMVRGVIGWIDPQDKKAADKINDLSSYSSIRGYKIAASGDLSSLARVMESLAQHQYTLDLSLSADTDTDACGKWIGAFRDQSFILENCGNPDTKKPPDAAWISQVKQLAKNQNLHCKVAGLFTLGNWKSWRPADFYPFLDILLESFGPHRLLYASDWPFLLLSGAYVQWKSLLGKYCEKWSAEDKENFFGENTRRLYQV